MSRTTRFSNLLPIEMLRKQKVAAIGVGAIGSQVVKMLATMGAEDIEIYDHDTISEENLGVQGYRPDQLGKTKVAALTADCKLINPNTIVVGKEEKFTKDSKTEARVIFCGVDTIPARKEIWDATKLRSNLFIDGRMAAEVFRIFTMINGEGENYEKTFYSDPEELPCAAKSTLYCAATASSLMIGQYTKWLRNMSLEPDFMYNFLSTELIIPCLEEKPS